MSKLFPMVQPEFVMFLDRLIPEYAAGNVRTGYWSEAEALEKSREAYAKNLYERVGYEAFSFDVTKKLYWLLN